MTAATEKFSLREAQETVDKIVEEVAGLLGVAIDDVLDQYGHSDIDRDVFFEAVDGGGVQTTRYARRFARELVLRIIYDGPVSIGYDEALDDRNPPAPVTSGDKP